MLPPAPGLFSTTTCWPHISESLAPRMRPIASMPPPGVNGTTSFTRRLGQAWANARPTGLAATTDAAAIRSRRRRSGISLTLDPGGLDDRAPQLHLGPDPCCELLRRRGDDLDAHLLKPSLDGRLGEDRDGVVVKLPDDLGRRLGREEERGPRGHVKAGQAGICDGREFHGGGEALRTAEPETVAP